MPEFIREWLTTLSDAQLEELSSWFEEGGDILDAIEDEKETR